MTVFEEFKRRGLIAQCTDEEKVKELLEKEKSHFLYWIRRHCRQFACWSFFTADCYQTSSKAGHVPMIAVGNRYNDDR